MNAKNNLPLLTRAFEILVAVLAFFVVNTNSLIRFRQFPEVDNYSDHEGDFLLVAGIAVVLMALFLLQKKLMPFYFAAWKQNKSLILFLVYCALSLVWSVYVPATVYKVLLLLFASIAGSYFAIRYRLRGVIDLLSWVGGFFSLLSLYIVLYFPFLGVMQNEIFLGSWTGIFWHRNHTGNIFAFFNMVFLLRLLWDSSGKWTHKLVFGCMYLLTATLVFGSRSATGIIVFLFLHFMVGLISGWLKVRRSMKPVHYYIAAGVLLAGFLIFITNTAFFFGLLGRSAQMTGRIPLWQDLFQRVYMEKPILGYGYGALWMQKRFRIDMQLHHDWPYQVYFADNGFFDILLNTGLVGILLFLAVYLPLGVRSLRQAVATKDWLSFVPFLTFLYIFIGNLTYSFLLEVDQLVWMLLVMMVFLTTRVQEVPQQQQYTPAIQPAKEDKVKV